MSPTESFAYRNVAFEWDADKAAANLVKHGIAFEVACQVFFDPFRRLVDAAIDDESRDAIIGYTESQSLLTVVHVARHEEEIRIISARRASKEERRLYEQL